MTRDLFAHGRSEVASPGARFILIERWADGPLIGYLGQNPSDASARSSDPTFTRFNGFARRWGFAGTVWANLAPYRSPQPADARRRLRAALGGRDWYDRDLLIRNEAELRAHAAAAPLWLAGWGAGGEALEAISPTLICHTVEALQVDGAGPRLIAFGLTQGACPAPKHVMARGVHRTPDDAPVFEFDADRGALGAEVPMPWRGA